MIRSIALVAVACVTFVLAGGAAVAMKLQGNLDQVEIGFLS